MFLWCRSLLPHLRPTSGWNSTACPCAPGETDRKRVQNRQGRGTIAYRGLTTWVATCLNAQHLPEPCLIINGTISDTNKISCDKFIYELVLLIINRPKYSTSIFRILLRTLAGIFSGPAITSTTRFAAFNLSVLNCSGHCHVYQRQSSEGYGFSLHLHEHIA